MFQNFQSNSNLGANTIIIGVASDFPSKMYHVTTPKLNYIFNSNNLFIDFFFGLIFTCLLIKNKYYLHTRKQTVIVVIVENESMTNIIGESNGEIRVIL